MPGHSESRSLPSRSPIADSAIAADLDDDELVDSASDTGETLRPIQEHSMAGSYRRPSFVGPGTRLAVLPGQLVPDHFLLSPEERIRMAKEERNLLRRALVAYGDRIRMSFAPPDLQQVIDAAFQDSPPIIRVEGETQ